MKYIWWILAFNFNGILKIFAHHDAPSLDLSQSSGKGKLFKFQKNFLWKNKHKDKVPKLGSDTLVTFFRTPASSTQNTKQLTSKKQWTTNDTNISRHETETSTPQITINVTTEHGIRISRTPSEINFNTSVAYLTTTESPLEMSFSTDRFMFTSETTYLQISLEQTTNHNTLIITGPQKHGIPREIISTTQLMIVVEPTSTPTSTMSGPLFLYISSTLPIQTRDIIGPGFGNFKITTTVLSTTTLHHMIVAIKKKKPTTMMDNRPSAVGLGTMGAVILIVFLICFVVLDSASLYRDLKRLKRRLGEYFRPFKNHRCKLSPKVQPVEWVCVPIQWVDDFKEPDSENKNNRI